MNCVISTCPPAPFHRFRNGVTISLGVHMKRSGHYKVNKKYREYLKKLFEYSQYEWLFKSLMTPDYRNNNPFDDDLPF